MSPRSIQMMKQNHLVCWILPAGHSPSTTVSTILTTGMSRNLLRQLQISPFVSSDPLSLCLLILMAASAFPFIQACQISQPSFSVDRTNRTWQIRREEIKMMLTVRLMAEDQPQGLKYSLKWTFLLITLFYFRFSPENSLREDFNCK